MSSEHSWLLLAAVICAVHCDSVSKTQYPNFVMILLDDIGWGDPSYNNGTTYTPNIDKWTKEANTITFHRGYAAAPVCSPTRASVLSGRTPNRDCIYNANGCGSKPAYNCSEPMPFPTSTFTIAQAVKKANPKYNTAFFGKWHLGNFWLKPGHEEDGMSHPGMHGFDYWLATEASAPSVTTNCGCFVPFENCVTGHYDNGPWCTNYWYANESSPIGVTNISDKILGEDAEYMVDQFQSWLQRTDMTQPFLVMLWMHPNHVEFLATDEWREACANGTACPKSDNYSSAQLDYFGDLAGIDVQIQRVKDLLKQYNVMNNTLIWLTSDNGPEGDEAGAYGNADWPGSANGLRGRKRDVWEGGIREPTLIQFDGYIENEHGFNSSYPIVTYDLLPTIMDLLHVQADNDWPIDGASLLPLFENFESIKSREKPMGWVFGSGSAYVNDTWKVVEMSHDCSGESCKPALYNLETDPRETTDLKGEYPDIFNALMQEKSEWLISVNNSQYNESKCAVNKTFVFDIGDLVS